MTCAHADIRPSQLWPDGAVDGTCHDCGETGFPIALPLAERHAPPEVRCGTFLTEERPLEDRLRGIAEARFRLASPARPRRWP